MAITYTFYVLTPFYCSTVNTMASTNSVHRLLQTNYTKYIAFIQLHE